MKILLIHNFSRDFNGEDVYFLSLVNLLRKKGHQVITYTKDNKDISDNLISNFQIACKLFWNKKASDELSSLIQKYRPEVAHFHNIFPLISPEAYRICNKNNIPVVQTIHNYRFMCPKAILFKNGKVCELCHNKFLFYPSIISCCYHRSRFASLIFGTSFYYHKLQKKFDCIDAFIFPNQFTKNCYQKHLFFPLSKTHVIPHFVEIRKKINNRNHISDYFLFVGRLSEEKGIIQLLKVFSSLPKIKLIVIGDGPLRGEVEKYRNCKNISIKKFLLHSKIYNYMQNAFFTVIPSLWYETGPLAMIESFANGTPVIVPKFGVFESVVKEGKNGIFYQQYNIEDLKLKIINAYKNRFLIQSMRTNAMIEYEAKFTPEKHYQDLLKLYKDLVKYTSCT